MAYSDIPDTEIEPGKPGSSSLFTKMRDNPEAIAAGESGAPKIANAAFADDTINGVKLIDKTLSRAKMVDKTITNSQIADQTLNNALLIDNNLNFSAKMLAQDVAPALWHVDNAANYIIPKGIWILKNTESQLLHIMLFDGTSWVESDVDLVGMQVVISDGINFALYNSYSGGFDVYAQKIF